MGNGYKHFADMLYYITFAWQLDRIRKEYKQALDRLMGAK